MKTARQILIATKKRKNIPLVKYLTIKDICEAMEEYAKIEWISVNKRVDIKGGKYLVYDPNWIEDNKIRTAFYRNYNGIWIADNGSDDVIHPTHYMKLPNEPTNE